VRLRAGFALAVFAFSSTPQQFAIRQAGGLGLSCFETFLDSDDEIERATAAFQVIRCSSVHCSDNVLSLCLSVYRSVRLLTGKFTITTSPYAQKALELRSGFDIIRREGL